jgi:hypothetical protein
VPCASSLKDSHNVVNASCNAVKLRDIQIFVRKLLDPEPFPLHVTIKDTVASTKSKMQETLGIDPKLQELVLRRMLLSNDITLEECGITNGELLILLIPSMFQCTSCFDYFKSRSKLNKHFCSVRFEARQELLRKAREEKRIRIKRGRLRRQVEYYLSDRNLRKDAFFHGKMSASPDGWISSQDLLACPIIKARGATADEIIACLANSTQLEASSGQVRRLGNAPLPVQI